MLFAKGQWGWREWVWWGRGVGTLALPALWLSKAAPSQVPS